MIQIEAGQVWEINNPERMYHLTVLQVSGRKASWSLSQGGGGEGSVGRLADTLEAVRARLIQ